MAEPLGYNEAMGSPEAHVQLMKTRVENARAAHVRAVEKGFTEQIENTKVLLEQAQAEYDELVGDIVA